MSGHKSVKYELISASLLLGYNELRSIEGLFESVMKIKGAPSDFLSTLMWVDLQHNYLTTIPKREFEQLPQLRTLYLHRNYITDLKELQSLDNLSHLMALTIHGNPVDRIPHFRQMFLDSRLIILSLLPRLKKLDTVVFSKKEKDNALHLTRYPGVKNNYRCKPEDIILPPLLDSAKGQKDEISYN